jgi:hypothetical protein
LGATQFVVEMANHDATVTDRTQEVEQGHRVPSTRNPDQVPPSRRESLFQITDIQRIQRHDACTLARVLPIFIDGICYSEFRLHGRI